MTFDLNGHRRALMTVGTKDMGAAVVGVLHKARVKVLTTARSIPTKPLEGVHFVAADLSTAGVCAAVGEPLLKAARTGNRSFERI